MMKCTREAHERCIFSSGCSMDCVVPDDGECADFIRAVTRGEGGQTDGAFAQAEEQYLSEERAAIQGETELPLEIIKKAIAACLHGNVCDECPLIQLKDCTDYLSASALSYIERLENGEG